MRKAMIVPLLPLLIFSFSSCSSNKGEHAIYCNLDYLLTVSEPTFDDYVLKPSSDELIAMKECNEDFVLFVGTEWCRICLDLRTIVMPYIAEHRICFYYADYATVYRPVMEQYPTLFPHVDAVPRVFVHHQETFTQLNNARFTDLQSFSTALNQLIHTDSSVYYSKRQDSLLNKLQDDETIVYCFTYSPNNNEAYSTWKNTIQSTVERKTKQTILLDVGAMDSSELQQLKDRFGNNAIAPGSYLRFSYAQIIEQITIDQPTYQTSIAEAITAWY